VAYPQAAVAQAAKSIVALRKLGGSCRCSRVDRMTVFVVGCLQTTLLYGPTFSVPSGVTAMITEASYSDSLTPALAYVNKRSDRTSRWPERWMIHRPDGSFALYLVNWGVRSTAHIQPSLTRIAELAVPQVVTALTSPQPANNENRFLEWLHQ